MEDLHLQHYILLPFVRSEHEFPLVFVFDLAAGNILIHSGKFNMNPSTDLPACCKQILFKKYIVQPLKKNCAVIT